MKPTTNAFYRLPIAIFACVFVAGISNTCGAAVVQRQSVGASSAATNGSRPTISRGQATAGAAALRTAATIAANTAATNTDESANDTSADIDTMMPALEETVVIENKSDRFDGGMATAGTAAGDGAADTLAEQIRRQRAALDLQSATSGGGSAQTVYGGNACDANLRACMQSKCGNDYSKCKGDTDTLWGTKMDACRRDLPCTGEEYRLFAAEIKADRDMNARLASYNAIIDCGNNYNDCIMTQCGTDYSKCLGKTAGDGAISACAKIAQNCIQQDSGLAARTVEVFGTLRQSAEVQIHKDEQRLYALRDQMRAVCARLGAMFDERSLDCVYTVGFYADAGSTLYSSQKAYAGGTFDCTPNWFGIDITTFKENAYRLTREQTAASSALLGAGAGTLVGAASSGMINRAIDTQRARRALNQSKKEDVENATESNSTTPNTTTDNNPANGTRSNTAPGQSNTTTTAPVVNVDNAPDMANFVPEDAPVGTTRGSAAPVVNVNNAPDMANFVPEGAPVGTTRGSAGNDNSDA